MRRAPSPSPDLRSASSRPGGTHRPCARRWSARLLVGLVALPLVACRADVSVEVALTPTGSGSVTASLVLDRQAVVAVGDRVEVGDLQRAGWTVAGPRTGPDGSETIIVAHPFASAAEAAALLGRLGSPLRLRVTHHHGTVSSSVGVGGTVDLHGGVDALAAGSGALPGGLSGALAAVARAGGAVPTVTAAVVARMPSRPRHVLGGGAVRGNTVTWAVPLGTSTAIGVTSVRSDATAKRWLVAAGLLAVALVIVVVAEAVVGARRSQVAVSPPP